MKTVQKIRYLLTVEFVAELSGLSHLNGLAAASFD
ncbi:MAG: hypothetical protein M2R45_00614 [Verrucomicrobia subdivision 3 bacterium]|nr:hypothetical protein [Limisphaerales bacterium]MCS1414503.1 hypothetical protein [Limisphaerales bacterium]